MWAPATLKLIFPPSKHRRRRYMQRASSPRRLRPVPHALALACAMRLAVCMCDVHHPGSSSDRRRVGNTIPHYRHPPDEQTSERTLARPFGEVFPPSARGLSEATRRRTTRRSARSEVGQPLVHSPTGSHRTPSPSVRPVTRERSPKREVRVRVWEMLVAAPGPRSSARAAASCHPLTRRAATGLPWSALLCAAPRCNYSSQDQKMRCLGLNPDLMIAIHAILS